MVIRIKGQTIALRVAVMPRSNSINIQILWHPRAKWTRLPTTRCSRVPLLRTTPARGRLRAVSHLIRRSCSVCRAKRHSLCFVHRSRDLGLPLTRATNIPTQRFTVRWQPATRWKLYRKLCASRCGKQPLLKSISQTSWSTMASLSLTWTSCMYCVALLSTSWTRPIRRRSKGTTSLSSIEANSSIRKQ